MSARTWALVSDNLMESGVPWEDVGLHVLEPGPYEYPGARWWKLLDDTAPEGLEGKRIDYAFTTDSDGANRIAGRRPAT